MKKTRTRTFRAAKGDLMKEGILNALKESETRTLTDAAKAMGLTLNGVYYHYNNDPNFKQAVIEIQKSLGRIGNRERGDATKVKILKAMSEPTSRTVADVCERAGISLRTFYFHRKDSEFNKEVLKLRREKLSCRIGGEESTEGFLDFVLSEITELKKELAELKANYQALLKSMRPNTKKSRNVSAHKEI